ncbi:MAG: hypothetical protein JXR10_14410 [Cyclobacteriaceae bacterium]
MRKFTFIIILVGIAFTGNTQKLEKYEDALPKILTLPPSGTLAELKPYLFEDYENASIYLQMALVYQKRYQSGDPFKDYAYKLGNAKEALNAFKFTERYITEKDVKKNEEYYFNFGTIDAKGRLDVEYDSIMNYMAASKKELQTYIANVPVIYEKFTKSFSNYDKAHKLFTDILGRYPTYKDLYLLYDEDVDKQFEEIKQAYLTSLDYWEEYKSASDTFDVGYDQKMTIAPVSVYRLDGLESKINFLEDDIQVWDYATWVDETRKSIKTDIDKLRTDLLAEDLRLNKKIQDAEPDFVRESFDQLKVSKEILFNLRKYDLNSVIEPIFIYKEKKHDLIYQDLMSKKAQEDSVDTERKLYLYGQMINRIKDADSVLSDIRRRNTTASYNKYADFIETSYSGREGITQFISTNRTEHKEKAAAVVDRIQTDLYDMLERDSVIATVKYKKKQIPLLESLSMDKESLTADPITTHLIENFDGSSFIGGVFLNEKEGKIQAYVTGITADNTVGWHNEYLLMMDSAAGFDSDTRVAALQSVPGGLAVILNGVDSSEQRMNHLFILDEKGLVTTSRRLMLDQYPRSISFKERSNTLFITYKGKDYLDDIFLESELIMASYSIYGDLQWQQRVSYKGDVADVISIDQGYLVVGNYNELKGLDGRVKRAGGSNTDTKLFAIKIDLGGEIQNIKAIEYAGSYFTNKSYKVSDDCINLFGSVGSYEKKIEVDSEPGSAVHIILNKDLDVLASTLK